MAAAPPRPTPRPAATLILLRDAPGGPEVLLLQRTQSAVFLGGAYVFPGGATDTADADARIQRRCLGAVSADPPLPYRVAAIRESFEEAGILLACAKDGTPVDAARAESLRHYRQRPFTELLEREDLYLQLDALAYYAHWITAPGRARRFDTRFFVAVAPEGQAGSHDAAETVHHLWIRPAEALERGAKNEFELVFATQQTLNDLKQHPGARAAVEHTLAAPEVEANRACWAQGREGAKLFRRADAPYFEIHWSDPEENGDTSYELVPGEPKRLDRYVTRIIAPNPGVMTGPGTNTYLVGNTSLAVIDPGPAIPQHIEKILEAGAGRIRWILCTHTHLDHSPAAAALKAATGAQLLGRPAPEGQDATFKPDFTPENGQRIEIGGAGEPLTLRAIHTPGHASNHLCYLLEQTKMLFTGDHVMQGSTVVINPPDGDMRAYLHSLEKLLGEDIAIIAPGHGYLIGAAHKELRRLIAHRLGREQKVVRALERLGPASLDELLPVVYDDVPARIHRVAARSLTAHLEKLAAEGAVRAADSRYTLVKSPAAG
jgi:glyoxylase-like metal-dependent hydrolase (beta-lactamase superfamily II)/8-oxo-dGTP pyrophosphatase MutT (NUDIX family)